MSPQAVEARRSDARPNVVLILADDLGYADLGVQGSTDLATPNIDAIAHNGVRFTSAYSVSPLCSPSRAALLTGRYPQRWGQEFNPRKNEEGGSFGIPDSVPTLAELLKRAGYATGIMGKWHMGSEPHNMPLARGFDEFYGFTGATHPYLPKRIQVRGTMIRGTSWVSEHEYITDAITREAVDFISRHRTKPFFLYVPYSAVHAPLEPDPARLARLGQIQDPERRAYAATVAAMDDGVGKIRDALSSAGLTGQTLVLFLSDNGGATMSVKASNGPLSGLKGLVNEGGVRVPFLAEWPGTIARGAVVDAPVSALDILPTVLSAARAPSVTGLDGVGVECLWHCDAQAPASRQLYWRLGDMDAVRDGDWKLVQYAGVPVRLYDLSRDVGEHVNVASAHPDVVTRLQREYATWAQTLVAPRWGEAEHIVRPPDETGVVRPAR